MTCSLSFLSWCFANNSLYHLGNCLYPSVYSSPFFSFVAFLLLTPWTLYSPCLYYFPLNVLCVSTTAVGVSCIRNAWITNEYIRYTGIPAVFICSGGIYCGFFGLFWGPVCVGPWCPDITMLWVGKICLNHECSHHLASMRSIPKNCAWGNKGLVSLSLHCTIM